MESSTPSPERGASSAPTPGATQAIVSEEPPPPSAPASTHLARALARLARLGTRFGDGRLAEEARAALAPVEENLLRMVALGQFKRGKSTLLNALLDVPLLPAGIAPVTSVSTVVRWAPSPGLTIRYEDGSVEETDVERLPDFVVESSNPGNALGVRLVEVGYPADLLEDGLVLVDTPGIGSTDRRATERAYGFLPSVDAGLVVLSPDPPVGEAEADYVRELAALTPHLIFVLNKVDLVSEAEWRELLAFDRQVLAGVLECDPEDVEIVPVSARRMLESGDPSVLALRERIEGFIRQKGARVRDELAARRLHAAAAKLKARLDVERHALDLEVRELEGRIAGLRGTLDSLQRRTERAAHAVTAAVEHVVVGAGDELLEHMRSRTAALTERLRDAVATRPVGTSNSGLAARFDEVLESGTWDVLDAWWQERGPGIVEHILGEMGRAADELAGARREAAEWIREAFGVALPDEPRVEALKESSSFYRHVEGVTPRLTVDLLRALLPRRWYAAWVRRGARRFASRALDMGAGQVRGDLLYRARETVRGFTADVRAWTLAGTEGLLEAASRAAELHAATDLAAEARHRELDEGIAELDALTGGAD